MRETLVTLISLVVGLGAGTGIYYSQYSNEENLLEVTKDVSNLPAATVETSKGLPVATVVDGPDFDFGTMSKNEERSHTFVIRNDGQSPLLIKLIETSCKCTLAKIDDSEIAPGESKEIRLTWKPENYSPSFSQNARIQTNDPEQRMLELRVTGRVSVPIRPEPAELIVSDIQSSDGFSETIDLYAYRVDDLDITSLSWQDDTRADRYELQVETLAPDDPAMEDDASIRSGVRITVTGRKGLPLGPLKEALVIETNQEDEPSLVIPVEGVVRGNYQFDTLRKAPFDSSRNLVDLGTISGAQTKELEIKLLVRGEFSDEVEISVDPEQIDPQGVLEAAVLPKEQIGALVSFPIRLRLAGNGQGLVRLGPQLADYGRVVVKTTDPEAPEIVLYVKFAITE